MFPLSLILVSSVAGFAAIFYFVYVYNRNYWKRKGIPSPPSDEFFANHWTKVTRFDYPINYVLQDWTKQYGPVYGILEGWMKTWVISDPKMANEMFVKKFEFFHARKRNPLIGNVDKNKRCHVFNARGARWKRLRAISSPSFNMNNLKKIYPTVDHSCQELMGFLDKAHEDGKSFNIHPYFHELTMDIIMRVAMGQTGSKLFENPYVEITKNIFLEFGGSTFGKLAMIFPFLSWPLRQIFMIYAVIVQSPFKVMLTELEKTVKERRKLKKNHSTSEHVDFIDLFIDAEDPTVKDVDFDKTGMKISKKMTEQEIISNCFVFLLAGFDTTANTLGVTCHFLAKYPEIQQKVFEEIQDVTSDSKMTFEKVNELRYMDAVMKEALRMYPIAGFAASRECMHSTTLGEYKISAGENVNIDVLTLHYNKDIWGDNAEEFYPERFFDFSTEQQMAYYPFGGGLRTCIGMRLAYLEEKLALYHILKKYKLVRTSESEEKLRMIGRTVQNPETVTLKLEKR